MAQSQTKSHLVTGGCGFVGRHLVNRLIKQGKSIWIIDDLSTGLHPTKWLPEKFRLIQHQANVYIYQNKKQKITFVKDDAIRFFSQQLGLGNFTRAHHLPNFSNVFHLASVVGGRAKIEGNPMAVAIDLAIDASFFLWATQNKQKIDRVLYASSSAAYPINLQAKKRALALKEKYIQFNENLGQPDMTYGWSKLTGEYLSQIAVEKYGLKVVCVRPFSGYGEDQDLTYPIPAIAERVARRDDPVVIWGSGDQGRDFVHIEDCIDAMLLAIQKITDGSGINIGSGKITTFKEVAQMYAEIAGYKPQIKPLVDKPTGVYSRYADINYMRKKLNWVPKISLQEGLTRVLMMAQKKLGRDLN